ncbi:MAG: chemotaxis protein CheW [Thermodesulfobacteriota bacterium]
MTSSDKIVFGFRNEGLAIDVEVVDSIVEVDRFFLIPHSPPFLRGIITLHSEVVTILDLPLLFQKDRGELKPPYRLVVTRMNNALLGFHIGNAPISFLWKENIDAGQCRQEGGRYTDGVIESREMKIKVISVASLLDLVENGIAGGSLVPAEGQ